ncbi:metal-dependent hydrolase [Geodermatophilus sp. URMC 61]|uniref:metal-dependent hydrolase n=1 Tax=Geodermatophilus sp. URMC 61 TaxID=3423411 RepID=UPI00406D4C99
MDPARVLQVVTHPWVVTGAATAAIATIAAIDTALAARTWPVPVVGLLDEPAHLLTTAVLLAAVLPVRLLPVVPWVLAGSVLIDVDHVPLYLPSAAQEHIDGRPITHSVATVLVLALAGSAARGRWRTALLGVGTGVSLHLVRDLAAPLGGPGVPLLWPVSPSSVTLPYPCYAAVLVAAVAVVALRQWRRSRQRPH